MTAMTSQDVLKAIGDGLEVASRWPRLLVVLGLEPEAGRPGALLLNNALQRRGYARVLDETDNLSILPEGPFPDLWWNRIAKEVTGRSDAGVDEVVARLQRVNNAAAE